MCLFYHLSFDSPPNPPSQLCLLSLSFAVHPENRICVVICCQLTSPSLFVQAILEEDEDDDVFTESFDEDVIDDGAVGKQGGASKKVKGKAPAHSGGRDRVTSSFNGKSSDDDEDDDDDDDDNGGGGGGGHGGDAAAIASVHMGCASSE